MTRVGVVVPVKSFARAKQRLSGALDESSRAALARWCAARVLRAAGRFDAHVVCDDPEVAQWAESERARVISCASTGLNTAIETALHSLAASGYDLAVIAHGDLPLAQNFEPLVLDGAITVIPDHRYDGTNAIVIPTALAGSFTFRYGHGSFRRHVVEAIRHSGTVRVYRDPDLARDLDTPEDLDDPHMEEVRAWLRTSRASLR